MGTGKSLVLGVPARRAAEFRRLFFCPVAVGKDTSNALGGEEWPVMKLLVFLPVLCNLFDNFRRVLRLEFGATQPHSVKLFMDGGGNLSAHEVPVNGARLANAQADQTLIGVLHYAPRAMDGTWYFLRCNASVTLDAMAPPLSVTALQVESILTCGEHSWMVAHVWKALPVEVPEAAKDDLCPVCRAPLSLAPVVFCNCGRALHLQTPVGDAANADDVLDCFLKAGTCECGIEATCDAQLLPKRAAYALRDRA